MEPTTTLVGVLTMIAGSSSVAFAAQVAQGGNEIITITSGGATFSAVAALIYVAKAMFSGQLVAKNTAETEQALAGMVDKLTALVESAERRERLFTQMILTGRIESSETDHHG